MPADLQETNPETRHNHYRHHSHNGRKALKQLISWKQPAFILLQDGYSLNYFTLSIAMEHSQANSHSASQEIPSLICKPKVHYRIHKSLSLVPILSQMRPVHIFPPCFLKIHSNIILPSYLHPHR